MSNYNDFDLDLKMVSENGAQSKGVSDYTVDIITSALTCWVKISKALNCTNGRECAMPTKDRPAASCHRAMAGAVQARC
ncbi:hypothetical protein [Clostridium senegalense]|uniref:hypothetical protein n=1 Tax=Clostridium senegalense TaxID=1465809 RepID=UPI000289A8E6|nr:hypothetical protein [Clostridium senegalense]